MSIAIDIDMDTGPLEKPRVLPQFVIPLKRESSYSKASVKEEVVPIGWTTG